MAFTTWVGIKIIAALFFSYIRADQFRYIFEHEKLVIDNFDKTLVNCDGKLYDLNQTKALNFSFTLKIVLEDDAALHAEALKWHNNQYGPAIIRISKTIKDTLDMTIFDIDNFITTSFRPPATWPIHKGVTYRTVGWTPDVTKFPPNLPTGKWKIPVIFLLGNKTEIAAISWYLKIVYKH